ncbi:ABC transporter permease/substrate binding protein [Streptomyces sp. NBC_01283]|uniref:ABC transporter permease/substrate binding protein n=1 Tax=Streptomyces sp. NBC_01283 TaxID=2903812 RepID=UPI00352C2905|nr:ABC transporter permease/substrate binding protein [Streptomyces sp. NBC_01283]
MPRIHIGDWVASGVDWLRDNCEWLFDFIKMVVGNAYDGVNAVLTSPEPLLLIGIFAVLAFWLRGILAAVATFAGFALIDSIEQWEPAMNTLSLVLVSCVIIFVFALPIGIWAAKNRTVSGVIRPVLDFMQTMPAMVYLIPGIFFFGVGPVPGMVATIVFAMPPAVRLAELGIRQVDEELIEAAEAFGTHPRNTLWRVQLPLALPTIMAGVNQAIMLALSMVVVAGMVGGGGLGSTVYDGISSVDVALGFEGGIAVVILAMYLDRMTGALNQRVSPLGRRALAKANSALGGLKIMRWKPATPVAMVGVLVLALVAGGLNIFGGDDEGPAVSANVGQGRSVKMGYIDWPEGTASTYLWKNVLEQRGFKPEVQSLEVGALYNGQAQGSVDVQTNSWLPATHAPYWSKYKNQLEDYGSWYDPTSLEIAVPKYVKGVKTLDDLKGKSSQFKGKIYGIEPGAGETKLYEDKVQNEYGLKGKYELVKSNTSAMLAQLDRAYKKKEPIAVTLWSPHWAYDKYKLTKLKDPKGAFGSGDGIHTLGRKGFAEKEPQVAQWLKDFKLSEAQLTSLEGAIQDAGKGNQDQGVKDWMKKNPGIVDKMAPVAKGTYEKGKQAGAAPNIGFPAWDEGIAATYLWKNVLEKRGYKPKTTKLDVGPLFTGLSTGQVDFELDGWLPVAQKQYWEKYKKDLVDVGAWYDKTTLEVAVPSYVKGVKTMDDLRKNKDKFKGRIVGIEPGTGQMTRLKDKVMPAYGLDGFELTSAGTSSMLAELERAYAKKEPVAVVLWSPHWAYNKYDLTRLKDPKKTWGANNQIKTLANKSFPKKYSELNGWLKNWHMSPDELMSLEQAVQKAGRGNEEDGVRKWVDAHPGIVDKMAPVK